MENKASGGSAFSHRQSEVGKGRSLANRFDPMETFAYIVTMILMTGVFCSAIFGLTSVLPHINVWSLNTGDVASHGGFRDPRESIFPIFSWGILPSILLSYILCAYFVFSRKKIPKKSFTIPAIVLILIGVVGMAMVNPFQSSHLQKESFDDWAKSSYGVELSKKLTVIKIKSDEKNYYGMYQDEKFDLIFAIKDPNRNNEIFLYNADGKNELKKIGEANNGK